MKYEDLLNKLDILNKRAESLYKSGDETSNKAHFELQALLICHEYIKLPPKDHLDYILKSALLSSICGKPPFPEAQRLINQQNGKVQGRPELDISPLKYVYYYCRTGGSENRTAKLLGVSNKTVSNHLPIKSELNKALKGKGASNVLPYINMILTDYKEEYEFEFQRSEEKYRIGKNKS
jgi:hypothetical protein